MTRTGMNSSEKLATVSLSTLFALRMLGLFMILPVFSLYGDQYTGANATLIGLAIGAYGLTQSIFQIPFGMLSDRIGRKVVIMMGLLVFALGSFTASAATSIYMVIFGRALQGAGAIASAVMALLADTTRDQHRTKAMAALGMSIGLSFAAALVLGPVMTDHFGLSGLFLITGIFALCGIGVCYFLVPTPVSSGMQRESVAVMGQFLKVLKNPELVRLDLGIFCLHMMLTACFVVLPIILADELGVPASQHWLIYLPILGGSFFAMIPLIIIAETKRRIKQVFVLSIMMLGVGLVGLSWHFQTLHWMCVFLFLFFMAFNLLEAMLPSLMSKLAPAGCKGTAMGVYSTGQFLGAFIGGISGGYIYGHYGTSAVFLYCSVLAVFWAVIAITMRQPQFLQSYMVTLKDDIDERGAKELLKRLLTIQGVKEAVVIVDEQAAYLKIDKKEFDQTALQQILV